MKCVVRGTAIPSTDTSPTIPPGGVTLAYLCDEEASVDAGEADHGAGQRGTGQHRLHALRERHQRPGQQVQRSSELDRPQYAQTVIERGRQQARCSGGNRCSGQLWIA